MRLGLVSVKISQEKEVGGLLKKGNTVKTTQMAVIKMLIIKANRRKYSVNDTLDPALAATWSSGCCMIWKVHNIIHIIVHAMLDPASTIEQLCRLVSTC